MSQVLTYSLFKHFFKVYLITKEKRRKICVFFSFNYAPPQKTMSNPFSIGSIIKQASNQHLVNFIMVNIYHFKF